VDCDNDPEICYDEFSVSETPEIHVASNSKDTELFVYTENSYTIEKIVEFAG